MNASATQAATRTPMIRTVKRTFRVYVRTFRTMNRTVFPEYFAVFPTTESTFFRVSFGFGSFFSVSFEGDATVSNNLVFCSSVPFSGISFPNVE